MAEAPPRSTPPWSDIPLDVAGMLLRFLPSYVDRVRFSAVCTQWHYAKKHLSLPQPLPLLLLPGGTLYSLPRSEPFCLPECTTRYARASSCGKWLLRSGDDGDCFLKDPFSKATVALPALSAVRLRCDDAEFHKVRLTLAIDEIFRLCLCSTHLVAAVVGSGFSHLALCSPGGSSWCICTSKQFVSGFSDVAFYKGKLYALLSNEDLLSLDISEDDTGNPWVSHSRQVIKGNHRASSTSPDGCSVLERLYLVESGNTLLKVRRKLFYRFRRPSFVEISFLGRKGKAKVVERNEFEVFEADFEQSRWAEVTTIGDDQALFLGQCCSRILCVSQYGLLGDHIFLENNDSDHFPYDKENVSSCSAYNMKDGATSSPLPMITGKQDTGSATWLFP